MKIDADRAKAGRQYADAYAAHYGAKNLQEALGLYRGVMAAHPDTQEAGYSQAQIRNIVKSVLPEQDLLVAQMELAFAHLRQKKSPGVNSDPATPLPAKLPD